MTLTTVRVGTLVEIARRAGLDGSDRGAVRRLIWDELGTDAIDHDVVDKVVELLHRSERVRPPVPRMLAHAGSKPRRPPGRA